MLNQILYGKGSNIWLPRSLTLHHTVSPSRSTKSIRFNFHQRHPHCQNFLEGYEPLWPRLYLFYLHTSRLSVNTNMGAELLGVPSLSVKKLWFYVTKVYHITYHKTHGFQSCASYCMGNIILKLFTRYINLKQTVVIYS